jgi:hypothetical protein
MRAFVVLYWGGSGMSSETVFQTRPFTDIVLRNLTA